MNADQPDFTREAWRTCRGLRGKVFKCCECSGEIVKGERYFLLAGKWSGEMGSFRYHAVCKKISDEQRDVLSADGVSWDDMPAIGELVETAVEDGHELDDFPTYWPRGVYLSRRALARYAAEAWKGRVVG